VFLATLLDDLLDVSRITRGVFALQKEYVNLQGLLPEALETARPLIDAKRHTVKLDWPAAPVEVEADPVRLVQIASNLLTNSLWSKASSNCMEGASRRAAKVWSEAANSW
jgi:signal transduction histidine kinase